MRVRPFQAHSAKDSVRERTVISTANIVNDDIFRDAPLIFARHSEAALRTNRNVARFFFIEILGDLFAHCIAYIINRATRILRRDHIWCLGVAAAMNSFEFADAASDCATLKVNFEKLRQALLKLQAADLDLQKNIPGAGRRSEVVRYAIRRQIGVIVDMHNAVSTVIWAIGEREADLSEHVEGMVARSDDDLQKLFDTI